MKFTYSWLLEHLETTTTPLEIERALTSLGLEVEDVTNLADKLKGFVVAYVQECTRHPNADRLSLCKVDIGQGDLIQVVCGASNVRAGLTIAFATEGSVVVSTGQVLKKGMLRGVESCGMICSAEELGLKDGTDGIMELDSSLIPGTPLGVAFGLDESVFDISLTPNRSDCFSVRGIARDLAAKGLGVLKPLIIPKPSFESALESPQVEIKDLGSCSSYHGVLIQGLQNLTSPDWLIKRLESVGQKSINAVVDITNFMALDLGQPLHAFDAAYCASGITVDFAFEGESFEALDEKTYTLSDTDLTIRSNEKPIALAGIMGGKESGCCENTQAIFLEAAHFKDTLIAKSGQRYQILSEARTRFERGVDESLEEAAFYKAVSHIVELCGGQACLPVVVQAPAQKAKTIPFDLETLSAWAGYSLDREKVINDLNALGFILKGDYLTVPTHRHDCTIAQDILEEILRLEGYDNLPSTPLMAPAFPISKDDRLRSLKRVAAARGMLESITWSFISQKEASYFAQACILDNPISQELSHMRPSLIPSLLKSATLNQDRSQNRLALFEMAPIYLANQTQEHVICGLRMGDISTINWNQKEKISDVFDVKADVLALLEHCGLKSDSLQLTRQGPSYYHPGRHGVLKLGQKIIATFGELHPKILKAFDQKFPVVVFELFLDRLPPLKSKKLSLKISPYQSVVRDFSFIVDEKLEADTLLKAVKKAHKDLITSVILFDVYQGKGVEEGKKSLAIQVKIEPFDRTLTEEDLNSLSQTIIQQVKTSTNGELRSA
ncbi:MAG TPA: phenylalanine--tRNA ligase subunit beta [Alphaproteobacteria bacterium]|nr:phenylalanine--tRNA ligase subunit beta [Alphaproteobacteria bacterium]